VEPGAFIALRSALRVFGFAGAELAEVFGGFGDDVGEEFHFDAAEGFAWVCMLGVGSKQAGGFNSGLGWEWDEVDGFIGGSNAIMVGVL